MSVQDKRRSSIEITHAQTNIEYTTKKKKNNPEQKLILLPFLGGFLFPKLALFYQRAYVRVRVCRKRENLSTRGYICIRRTKRNREKENNISKKKKIMRNYTK